MALGFVEHDALVNVLRENPVGKPFLLLIICTYASTLKLGLSAPTPTHTPETHQKLSYMTYHDDWLSP